MTAPARPSAPSVRVGISTISFRHRPLTEALRLIAATGAREIDLGAIPDVTDHVPVPFTGDPAAEVARMQGARFAITGADAPSIAAARRLVALLGGVAVEVAEEHRALYHAALCHAANHLVTLIAGASDALVAAGVAEPGALLAPLVRAALDNSLDRGIDALSGPLLRGDRDTIGNHLTALNAHTPELLPAYRAMALATLDALDRDEGALRADLSRQSGC